MWFLFFQSGYFSSAAELKPLLHVWSLSIEEQYYLLLPAFLVFVPRKYWPSGSIALLLASLVLCLLFLTIKPVATFLPPSHAGAGKWASVRWRAILAPYSERARGWVRCDVSGPAVIVLIVVPDRTDRASPSRAGCDPGFAWPR